MATKRHQDLLTIFERYRCYQHGRPFRWRWLEVDPGLGARRDRLDVAVPDPDELDAALERHAGAPVLHQPAALDPDPPHLMSRFALQPHRVSSGLEDLDPFEDHVFAVVFHEDAVRLRAR